MPDSLKPKVLRRPTEDYMRQIVNHQKTYEFRKQLYPSTVKRIWFYETMPLSAITYICEVLPAHVGTESTQTAPGIGGDSDEFDPLLLDGLGNADYNTFHPTFGGYNYAYRVISCYKLRQPIKLERMKDTYGIGGAPRGMVYVPQEMMQHVKREEQECVWTYAVKYQVTQA